MVVPPTESNPLAAPAAAPSASPGGPTLPPPPPPSSDMPAGDAPDELPPDVTPPARTASAGRVLLVGLVGLVLAALLNAQALLKDAQDKPLEWPRDVSLAVWEPTETISRTVGLHLPRLWLAQAMSRTDTLSTTADDAPGVVTTGDGDGVAPTPTAAPTATTAAPTVVDIDAPDDSGPASTLGPATSVTAPETTDATGTTTTVPTDDGPDETTDAAPRLLGTVDNPLRLLVLGDSLVHFFGSEMASLANATSVISADTDSVISSGLSRPDYFDWPEHLATTLANDDADALVLMFGGNDAQGLITATGTVQPFSDGWKTEYARRVGEIMDIAAAEPRRQVLWVGLPPMRDAGFEAKMRELDAIYEAEAGQRPRVTYVPTYQLFLGPDGSYSRYVVDDDGQRVDARLSDGIHFSTAGGELLSRELLKVLGTVADLGIPS